MTWRFRSILAWYTMGCSLDRKVVPVNPRVMGYSLHLGGGFKQFFYFHNFIPNPWEDDPKLGIVTLPLSMPVKS